MKNKVERINGDQLLLNSIVGKSLTEAKELAGFNGFAIRIVREDGERYMVTMEHRMDRINVEIDNGIVTKTNIG